MSDLRKAADQALEALEHHGGHLPWNSFVEIRKVLRAALTEPEQEPVAWQCSVCGGGPLLCPHNQTDVPLYAKPPQRKPLTGEEIELHFDTFITGGLNGFARAIERTHGIK